MASAALRATLLPFPTFFNRRHHAVARFFSLSAYVIAPKELHESLEENVQSKTSTSARTIPISAAWFMPNDTQGRTGIESFKNKRIPTSRFFDIDDIRDHDSPYPHMLPTCEAFAKAMQKIGVRKEDRLVVYDTEELGLFSAPRVAWTLRVFGHPKVHILNNFRIWCSDGLSTESGEPEVPEPSHYPVPSYQTEMVAKFAEMKTIAYGHDKEWSEEIQILDARTKGRFEGTEPEPRPGLPSGHMPGSISVPFQELLHPGTRALLPPEELKQVFISKQLDPNKPIILSCGTGVTAAIIEAALQQAPYGKPEDRRLYDGSWTEWAARVSASSGLVRTTRT